ncbi:PQQ-dependent sugar dehydrogenase [Hyphococcus lacteus]|uniref:PQQ-dependent sugar dehydrogenase n=1 Tax=Hyphococcus lacteus TaxID=3143536 RepID=A0ABV3ZBH2_9PROT
MNRFSGTAFSASLFGILFISVASAEQNSVEGRPPNALQQSPAFEGQTRAPEQKAGVAFDVETILSGLDHPWGMVFLPDGRMLLSDRTTIRIVAEDGAISLPIIGVPTVDTGDQGGVLDLALDPNFSDNNRIFFTFSEPGEKPLTSTAVARATLVEREGQAKLDNLTIIFSQSPKLDSRQHYGGRIAFAQDGNLFVTTGERYVLEGRPQAQALDSLLGKIVRIRPNGSIPADNPFVGNDDVRPEIWSSGHRNVQGAAIHPSTGELWTIEHGPRGGDELNIPQAGKNYGWPIVTYGVEYNGDTIGAGLTQKEGIEQPIYYWDPVIAPSGMVFYNSDAVPEWKGSLFIAGLGGRHIARLTLDGNRVVGEERLLVDLKERFRDVEVGPDGSLYVLTNTRFDGKLLKLTPK